MQTTEMVHDVDFRMICLWGFPGVCFLSGSVTTQKMSCLQFLCFQILRLERQNLMNHTHERQASIDKPSGDEPEAWLRWITPNGCQ